MPEALLTIIIVAVVIFIVVFALKGFTIVQQSETMVIERLGRYNRTLESGVNIIWPIVERPKAIEWRNQEVMPDGNHIYRQRRTNRLDLRETLYDFPRQSVITKDNVMTEVNALLYFQVIDPVRAVYEIANLPDAIEKLTQTTLRNVIGELDLDETLTSRDTINAKIRAILDEASDKWGVKVNRVELQDISPPQDIRAAMEQQMRAERARRAVILEAEGAKRANVLDAEGTKEADINQAEGQKQARILYAEGEAEARMRIANAEAESIRLIASAVADTKGDPTQYLIALRYLETFREMVSGKDNKVIYIPYEATATMGSLGALKELFDSQKGA
ncbi:MAG: SPFH domain-containing protein [FCB group bacterium]|jgi:regulator of protease activity HflC (stomatin/prohibitin superfamily)|nr:SPFH domain-containing protein [FCB group bacterium]